MFGWRVIRVDGDSMTPLLHDGDYALVQDPTASRPPAAGDVVLVDHPVFGRIVKCLGPAGGENGGAGFALYGLSPRSTSRARLGRVGRDRVLGRLRWRISPAGLTRLNPTPQPQEQIEESPCSSP